MKYHFFHILALDPQNETDRLNQFLQQQPIHSVDRQFVADGSNSFWSICVCVLQPNLSSQNNVSKPKKVKVDYQEVLSPQHFVRFDQLRKIRNTLSNQLAIPAYAVFTNEQLAEISQLEKIDLTSMAQIKGIGGKRLNEYAKTLLEMLGEQDG